MRKMKKNRTEKSGGRAFFRLERRRAPTMKLGEFWRRRGKKEEEEEEEEEWEEEEEVEPSFRVTSEG